jgi:hypothetical protein
MKFGNDIERVASVSSLIRLSSRNSTDVKFLNRPIEPYSYKEEFYFGERSFQNVIEEMLFGDII